MSQIITDHYATTLTDAVLSGERQIVRTHHGFQIPIPIKTKHLGQSISVKNRLGTNLTRQIESYVAKGYSVRLPVGRKHMMLSIYSHSICKSELYALNRLRGFHRRHGDDGFAHLKDFNGPRHGNWARLRWWGLIEPRPLQEGETPKDVRGWWRLTGRGHAWLRGDETIPRSALIFDGVWIGWRNVSDQISPTEVDKEFDLERVMMTSGAA